MICKAKLSKWKSRNCELTDRIHPNRYMCIHLTWVGLSSERDWLLIMVMSISAQPTALVAVNKEINPSLGSQLRPILTFQGLHTTSVATNRLPKWLRHQVEVSQRG